MELWRVEKETFCKSLQHVRFTGQVAGHGDIEDSSCWPQTLMTFALLKSCRQYSRKKDAACPIVLQKHLEPYFNLLGEKKREILLLMNNKYPKPWPIPFFGAHKSYARISHRGSICWADSLTPYLQNQCEDCRTIQMPCKHTTKSNEHSPSLLRSSSRL